jgi:hypothetical protein
MDSKKASDLVDTDNLKKQLREVAAQVKNGETATVPFSYMYGSPIEFNIKRDAKGNLTIEPNFVAVSMDEQHILEQPIKQSIDSVMKDQPPVFSGTQSNQVAKGLLSMHSIFGKRPMHHPDTTKTVHAHPAKPKDSGYNK